MKKNKALFGVVLFLLTMMIAIFTYAMYIFFSKEMNSEESSKTKALVLSLISISIILVIFFSYVLVRIFFLKKASHCFIKAVENR